MKLISKVAVPLSVLAALSGCGTPTEPAASKSAETAQNTELAAAAFVNACLKTVFAPDTAKAALLDAGFRAVSARTSFESDFATAKLSINKETGQTGQCTVTPKGNGTPDASFAALRTLVPASEIDTQPLPGERGWIVVDTGAIAFTSQGGSMVRTNPGVLRRNS